MRQRAKKEALFLIIAMSGVTGPVEADTPGLFGEDALTIDMRNAYSGRDCNADSHQWA